MAIPPISINPLLKLFRTEQPGADNKDSKLQEQAKTGASAAQQDIVEISAAAQERLDGIRNLETPDEARETAVETRAILEEGDDTLGLEPDFS